jgi:hypothetical protein
MPTPLISQPISTAPAPAPAAVFCGNAKMPLPIIEPTTMAVSSGSGSAREPVDSVGVAAGVAALADADGTGVV